MRNEISVATLEVAVVKLVDMYAATRKAFDKGKIPDAEGKETVEDKKEAVEVKKTSD